MMNDSFDENAQPSIEQRLTAVLMGEADAATIAAVEAALEVDPDLRARRDSIQHTLGLIKQASSMPGAGVLDEARRKTLRDAAQQQLQPRRWRPPLFLSAAALLLLVGGVAYLNQETWLAPTETVHVGVTVLDEMGYTKGAGSDSGSFPTEERHLLSELGYADSSAGVPAEKENLSLGAASLRRANSESAKNQKSTEGKVWDSGRFGGGKRERAPTKKDVWRELGGGTMPSPTTPSSPAGPAAPTALSTPTASSTPSNPSTSSIPSGSRDGLSSAVTPGISGDVNLGLDFEVDILERPTPEGIGYVDGFDGDDLRVRVEPTFDSSGGRLNKRESSRAQPRCIVFDGYGRRYVDRNVMMYLHPQYQGESPRDMFFRYYGDNPEVITKLEALSTFSADVDTASYPLARNYLVNGNLPPKQSIRTEEFINYFDYELAAPTEGDFAVHLQALPSLFGGNGDRTLLSIGIKAREVLDENRKPMNLVFVIDKSGSMAGERMQLVKDALELLVDQMRREDTLGIVVFDSRGHIKLEPTSARERWKLREVIRNLTTGGSTNAAEGLEMGYKMMETCFSPDRINRLVLASDGVANTGETDQERILAMVRAQAEADVDLTTLGVGMGNHNDVFLEQLANKGDGSCHYIDDFEEAKRVLVEQFLGTMVTIAREVKIQVEFDNKVVKRWRQLGYENRSLKHADFRNDAIDAGEVGSGHEVTALYELDTISTAEANGKLATVRLRWFPDGSTEAVEREFQLTLDEVSSRWGLAPARLRLAAVVAQYAEVLRRSYHSREDSYLTLREEVGKLVQELKGDKDVRELRDMIERTVDLARWTPPLDELSILIESMREQQLQSAQLHLLGGDEEETVLLLAALERQNQQIEQRLLELLEE